MALGSTQPLTETSTRNISWRKRRPVGRDELTAFTCRLSRNVGVSTSWNPQGLSRYYFNFTFTFAGYQDHHFIVSKLCILAAGCLYGMPRRIVKTNRVSYDAVLSVRQGLNSSMW
jgi:hypothetical protein